LEQVEPLPINLFLPICDDEERLLSRLFTKYEVKVALFSIGGIKISGPDSFHGMCFKKVGMMPG